MIFFGHYQRFRFANIYIYKMSCICYYKLHLGHPFCGRSQQFAFILERNLSMDQLYIHAHLHLGIPIEICKYICTQVFCCVENEVWRHCVVVSFIGSHEWERNSEWCASQVLSTDWAFFVLLYTSVTAHWSLVLFILALFFAVSELQSAFSFPLTSLLNYRHILFYPQAAYSMHIFLLYSICIYI